MDDYLEEMTEFNNDQLDYIESLDEGIGAEKPEWYEELDDMGYESMSLFK